MSTFIYIAVVILTGTVIYLNQKGHLEDDSIAEEVVEHAIEATTDLEVDLSPDSKE